MILATQLTPQERINQAALLLNDLWDEVLLSDEVPESPIARTVDEVLGQSGAKTYKYILMTQLLGRAVDEGVNPLVFQVASPLPGAWDARGLCEEVITKGGFEENALLGILGRTKQPYNNSPGQKTHLDKLDTQVRKSDIPMRNRMIDALGRMDSREKATAALKYFLYVCKRQIDEVRSEEPDAWIGPEDVAAARAVEFLSKLSRIGRSGEGLSLATALLLDQALGDKGFEVVLHQINSSKRGQGDIDVYQGADRFLTVEIKDKPFTVDLVASYVQEAQRDGVARVAFVYGQNAGDARAIATSFERRRWLEEGMMVSLLSFEELADGLSLAIAQFSPERLRSTMIDMIRAANVAPESASPARQCLREFLDSLGE